ncbi:MAG: hypothetical protein LBG28_02610 [Tannerella sp.]|jgi:hypothetical protein|nr:hypothetical protein [Tannerella sp.]
MGCLEVYIHINFMCTNLKKCIAKTFEKVFIEWFYLNDTPVSIVRLYIKGDLYFDITCCEENVSIREQEEIPENKVFQEFAYKPIEQNIEWLHQCKIDSIKYLMDLHNIKRGILFIFHNNHNFVYYNKGYEFDDNDIFEIDANIKLLPYVLIDI